MTKQKLAVLFGGRSPEHRISLLSATSVIATLDTDRFEKVLIGIDSKGDWFYYGGKVVFDYAGDPTKIALPSGGEPILFSPSASDKATYSKNTGALITTIDAVFPVLHGLHGEDGSVQGLLRLADLPFVGCDIAGSTICMDKDLTKRLLRDAGITVADFVTFRKGQANPSYAEVSEQLGAALYIKPANLGSSVGVSFADNATDFEKALAEAFRYDEKVVVETSITGREIECAVLGNDTPQASVIGEVAPTSEFYTFESKYVDKDDAKLSIPANISDANAERARDLAVRVFTTLECKGFSRVDMFLTPSDELIVNEVNTIPGFTSISMYPKLWEYSGLSYKDLLSRLVDLAIELHAMRSM